MEDERQNVEEEYMDLSLPGAKEHNDNTDPGTLRTKYTLELHVFDKDGAKTVKTDPTTHEKIYDGKTPVYETEIFICDMDELPEENEHVSFTAFDFLQRHKLMPAATKSDLDMYKSREYYKDGVNNLFQKKLDSGILEPPAKHKNILPRIRTRIQKKELRSAISAFQKFQGIKDTTYYNHLIITAKLLLEAGIAQENIMELLRGELNGQNMFMKNIETYSGLEVIKLASKLLENQTSDGSSPTGTTIQ
jgi:hypothetical protein